MTSSVCFDAIFEFGNNERKGRTSLLPACFSSRCSHESAQRLRRLVTFIFHAPKSSTRLVGFISEKKTQISRLETQCYICGRSEQIEKAKTCSTQMRTFGNLLSYLARRQPSRSDGSLRNARLFVLSFEIGRSAFRKSGHKNQICLLGHALGESE